jgi:hypothetical protein
MQGNMIKTSSWPRVRLTAIALCALNLTGLPLRAQDAAEATPKMQLPADRREYEAAAKISDPAQRLVAFRAFIENNPHSLRVYLAQELILQTLVKFYSDRTDQIDQISKAMIDNSISQAKPYLKEYYVAGLLAAAEPNGVDLPLAETYAKDSVQQLTEENFVTQAKANQEKYKLPAQSAEAMHRTFAKSRTNALASLANVYLDEGRLKEASDVLAEGYAMSSHVSKISFLMGRVALLRNQDALALEDFERAQVLGGLEQPWLAKMTALYASAHGGSDAGLTESLDREYSQLFPPPFTPSARQPGTANHTLLLELYTGSGCPPCVAADLASEALLKSYSRSEVVILEQDMHIPEPDPLANPDSVARGTLANVNSTPTFLVDGKRIFSLGGTREESEALYNKLTKMVDAEDLVASPVKLTLKAQPGAGGTVNARAVVSIGAIDDVRSMLAKQVAIVLLASPSDSKPVVTTSSGSPSPTSAPATAPTSPAAPVKPAEDPALRLNFALVEDDIRYSGENGVRFHRMVVRALSRPVDNEQVVSPGSTVTLDATFDPAAISAKWATYLSSYENNNERYGKIKFLSKDTTMDPSHLAVAVWVEDSTTHRVFQAAFIPVAQEK